MNDLITYPHHNFASGYNKHKKHIAHAQHTQSMEAYSLLQKMGLLLIRQNKTNVGRKEGGKARPAASLQSSRGRRGRRIGACGRAEGREQKKVRMYYKVRKQRDGSYWHFKKTGSPFRPPQIKSQLHHFLAIKQFLKSSINSASSSLVGPTSGFASVWVFQEASAKRLTTKKKRPWRMTGEGV